MQIFSIFALGNIAKFLINAVIMKKEFVLKDSYRRDLLNLSREIDDILNRHYFVDSIDSIRHPLLPALFRVYSHIWCVRQSDMWKCIGKRNIIG